MSTTDTTTYPPVDELYVDSIDIMPEDMDWAEGAHEGAGYPEAWDYIRVPACPACETVVSDEPQTVSITRDQLAEHGIELDELDLDHLSADQLDELPLATPQCCPNPDCEQFRQEVDEYGDGDDGPMMNYYYLLPSKRSGSSDSYDRSDAAKLDGLPLVIVNFHEGPHAGEQALALSGGGMDLSWEICEAFMRLGFLPPAKFADLPAMAGYPRNARHRWIIDGCRRTFTVQAGFADRSIDSLDRMKVGGTGWNGYTRMHRLDLRVPADMLEIIAGYDAARMLRELSFATAALDTDDQASLRWMAALCAARVAELDAADEADGPRLCPREVGTPEPPEHARRMAHKGERVKVLAELGDDDRDVEVGRMFRIEYQDGTTDDVFADELTVTPELGAGEKGDE